MDQKELKQWEGRCIQEEPPECTAACPFHIDVRGFIGHVREGKWQAAWQILARSMPIPGVLGRICDGPCQANCKRGQAGDPIRIAALERACVAQVPGDLGFTKLPSKEKCVAVFGSGLSSLTVAWDLVRKGYAVTLFEPEGHLCAALPPRYAAVLTQDSVDRELARLETWGVIFQTHAPVQSEVFFLKILDGFDALYIGLDSVSPDAWPVPRDPDGAPAFDAATHATGTPKLFAGGVSPSTIHLAAQGRWAATTMDRALQKVSLTAGREKEGPYETRLYTRIEDIAPEPAVAMDAPLVGYTAQQAVAEASRCLMCDCMACVKVCPYLKKYGAYPRKYAREIFNNESMFMGARRANTMINTCSLCGLCETVCPENFAMQDLCLQARRTMVQNDLMPPSAHEFALEDMAFSQSDAFFMARHAPGADRSRFLFFPGCQLCASAPEQTAALYDHLRNTMAGGVGLMLGCCGAPAHWSGREAETGKVISGLQKQWQELGEPALIVACSTCLKMFAELWPAVPVQSVWETLEKTGWPERPHVSSVAPVAVHDPCTTRKMPAVQEAVRRLAAGMGLDTLELPLTRAETECCGYGGLMQNANPGLAREVIHRRAALSDADYLTYCAMCRDNLIAAGKRTLHILDLIFPDDRQTDPAGRPRPGWSRRRENRARLKADLLEKVWQEPLSTEAQTREVVVHIAPEVQVLLDQRRILTQDIQFTIAHAEANNRKVRHPETGRFRAAHQPRYVTFWVEYRPVDNGYEVFNAYSHRMEVAASGGC